MSEKPAKLSKVFKNQSELDIMLILKNQQVIMKALYIMMRSMVGDMEMAEELKKQAKDSYDYLEAREAP